MNSPGHRRTALSGRLVAIVAILSLAACGNGGNYGDSGSPPVQGSRLFAADSGNHAIGSLINSNPMPGTITVDRIITGSNTGLAGLDVPAIALDSTRDLLYVSNPLGVIVFANAGTANGDLAPARTPATASAGNFSSIYLDTGHDRLYVAEDNTGVNVYDNASTLNLASPNRTLTGNFGTGFNIRSLAVDVGRDILYVAVTTPAPTSLILVFNGAAGISGTSVTADRTIAFAASADISIFLDAAADRLYVSDPDGVISVLDNASTQDVAAVAARTIDPGLGALMTRLALDSTNDRLYLAAHSFLIVVPNVSTANGSVTGTALSAPAGGDVTAVAVRP